MDIKKRAFFPKRAHCPAKYAPGPGGFFFSFFRNNRKGAPGLTTKVCFLDAFGENRGLKDFPPAPPGGNCPQKKARSPFFFSFAFQVGF